MTRHLSYDAMSATLPLDGIRVVDFSRVLAGPLCGAMLGDMGADVIKIEDVGAGDESRAWASPLASGESPSYIANNRNKRALALDLKSPAGLAVAKRLLDSADVLIENFGTGAMEDFGLGYDTLAARNPRLIYCSISAFGRSGPRAHGAGYEALMQAFAGVMSITGEPDGAPVRCGISALDIMTGTLCSYGIVNAILHRQQTGRGQRVDGSLLDTAIGLLNFQAQGTLLGGAAPRPLGSAHPSLVPYRNFRCRDGQWVFIAGANERLWRRLATALGLTSMVDDPRYADNVSRVRHRSDVEARVAEAVIGFDRDPLIAHLDEAGVPVTPVNSVDQVLRDPQMASRPVLKSMAHPTLGEIPIVGMPVGFSDIEPGVRRHAPGQGEHTDELLAELGYTGDQVAVMRAQMIVR